jgi:hypothetical protein
MWGKVEERKVRHQPMPVLPHCDPKPKHCEVVFVGGG